MLTDLLAGVLLFTGLVTILVLLVLGARQLLVPRGQVTLTLNDGRTFRVAAGRKLGVALSGVGIHLPAACGGKGTCGLCRVQVTAGGGPALPTDVHWFTRKERAEGRRLACQITLREDAVVNVPEEILLVREVEARVVSNRSIATFMRELVLALPEGEVFPFRAGSFIQLTCPPYCVRYSDLEVDPEYREEWGRLDLWRHIASTDRPTTRAYSLANHADEDCDLMLVVRLATPPPGADESVPPGIVSSYIFGLRPGDAVSIEGPYGHFTVDEAERELVFVGGGAGMAPMRAHILEQLQTLENGQRITFFYGARSLRELCYAELFDGLQAEHENFRWHVALSEPQPEDHWEGPTGFIHETLAAWLGDHAEPDRCAYYLCGPPLMVHATRGVLEDFGVEPEDVHADDFGA